MPSSELDIMEGLTKEEAITTFHSACVRQKSNMSQSSGNYRFDSGHFEPEVLLNDMKDFSPKLEKLLKKIEDLDKKDERKYGKKFKHFIFSDLKSAAYGPKFISSGLIAKGYTLGYTAKEMKGDKWGAMELLTDAELKKTRGSNFYLLSSVSVYDKPISTKTKKDILSKFNQRPENINGDLARIIVMDSGFKEGIDLFDIKYIHIFEPSVNMADQKQVIGRGTRTCGQKGLDFHPNKGWPLHVFIYDLEFPKKYTSKFLNSDTAFELYMKSIHLDARLMNFTSDLEETSVYGSVDYELNQNVHRFTIEDDDSDDEDERLYGGSSPKGKLGAKFQQMRDLVNERYREFTWEPVKMENTCAVPDKKTGGVGTAIEYNPTQNFIRHYFSPQAPVKGMLLWHSTGTGKCHAKDTPILMYDGSVKMVQDIMEGEVLMGDDSTPRKVLSLANGQDEMYDIIPIRGEKYTVNSVHILCLKPRNIGIKYIGRQKNKPYCFSHIDSTCKMISTSFSTREEAVKYQEQILAKNTIIEIEVKDYLHLPKHIKHNLKGYRTGVDFPTQDISIDPYLIGVWLGDGTKRGPVISSQDSTILLREFCTKNNMGTKNIVESLTQYNLIDNKHIPIEYKTNSRENRLSLLAGLLDSDGHLDKNGHSYVITQKNSILADDIVYLCRSLGFAAYKKSWTYKGQKKTGEYNRIHISGESLHEIPVKIERKRVTEKGVNKKNALVYGFTIESKGRGDYYGFTLDGNNRYILGDFTVTHNTCSAIAAASRNFESQGYTILWVTRTTLKNDIWKNMFSLICNESLRNKTDEIPADPKKQMGMLSKAWRIRPISYKQFSNLVSKENDYYKRLVKENGEEDPLRKTLLIIDEAHKLYGGGDLSSIERPDMAALHKSLMHSYAVSGNDSVRLLLMTATPITENPMELIQLMNLCKPIGQQLPGTFESFKNDYLDANGRFTERGRTKYVDDIAGHISYLNREKDARQFAQPIIKRVLVKITDESLVNKFDRGLVKNDLDATLLDLKTKTSETTKELEGDLSEIDANRFAHLKKHCQNTVVKGSTCEKIVKRNIRELVQEIKVYKKSIKDQIKKIKDETKSATTYKQKEMEKIKNNMERFPEEYEKYKKSPFFLLKTECGKTVKSNQEVLEQLEEHPEIQKYNENIQNNQSYIEQLNASLKIDSDAFKLKMREMRELLKSDLSDIERSVVKMTIRENEQNYKTSRKNLTKKIQKNIEENNAYMKELKNKKKEKYKKVQTSLKNMLAKGKKEEKRKEKEAKLLRKSLRKQGELEDDIKDKVIKEMVDKQQVMLDRDLKQAEKEERAKMEEKEEKAKEKEEKRREKQEKAKEKEEKKREKQEMKKETRRLKQELSDRKKREREEKKSRKNKK